LQDIILPPVMSLRVAETAPPQKGGSDAAWKAARLERGLEIMVPLFIAPGELIRVETQGRKYVGKETEDKKG
jgi:elongation factor P